MEWLLWAGGHEPFDDLKDREEFLPWSSGNATTAATVKKKYQVSGFFKVSKYRQEKLSYFVENGGPCHDLVNDTTSSSNELLQDTLKSPRNNTETHLNWIQRLVVFWHSTFYFMSITNVLLLIILFATLAFNLNLTIKTLDENCLLMSYLAIALLTHHLEFLCLWDNTTQSIQSWNREDSFWWIILYFFQMVTKIFLN